MADKTVEMQASDLFSLGANFKDQGSSSNVLLDFAAVADANGDVAGGCEDAGTNSRTDYTARYEYCGTDIRTDLGALVNAFGEVSDSKAVTELSIEWRQDSYPVVSITGHQHTANAHASLRNFNVSADIPASSGGVGVPDIFANGDADSDATSASLRFSLTHTDANDSDNAHWTGTNTNARADASVEYIGAPSLTTTNWKVDSANSSDSNTEFDSYAISAHKFYTGV